MKIITIISVVLLIIYHLYFIYNLLSVKRRKKHSFKYHTMNFKKKS